MTPRKAAIATDVWEAKRANLFLAQLEAAADDKWRFLDLLERFVYFLEDERTKKALSANDYAFVKEICEGRLVHIIDEFNTRFPNAKPYVKFYGKEMTTLDFFDIILKTYKI